jgi:hypothetical protein
MFSVFAEEKLPFEIQRIVDAKQRKIEEIEKQYEQALLKQKKIYLSREDMESAKIIDTMLHGPEQKVKKEEEPSQQAKIYTKAKFMRIKVGGNYFEGDHPSVFQSFPDGYENYRISLCQCNPKDPLGFKVKRAGIVTLILNKNTADKYVHDGWTIVDEASRTLVDGKIQKLNIIQKKMSEGEYKFDMDHSFSGVRLLVLK